MNASELATLKAVLTVLNNCDGHAIPIETLAIEANAAIEGPEPATRTEIRAALQHARQKGWADYQVSRLDRSERYYITAEGRIVLRENF